MRTYSLGALLALCTTLFFAFTNLWAQLALASPAVLLLLAAALLAAPTLLRAQIPALPDPPAQRPTRANLAIGLMLIAPATVYFALTARQEFPFSGDYDHHMYMAHHLIAYFGWWLALVPTLTAATIYIAARHTPYAYFALLVCAGAISTQIPSQEFLVRYPGATYTLAVPFNLVLEHFAHLHPMLGLRLTNLLSLPAYLFLLRPLLLGRWPDARALVLTLPWLCQQEWIYFTSTTYLEPWSLVLTWLALEATLDDGIHPLWAPLLAGLGCMFKEQAIFALALTTAHALWRTRRELKTEQTLLTTIMLFLPFFTYWSIRKNSNVFRQVVPGSLADALSPERLAAWAEHMQDHLQMTGLIAFSLIIAITLVTLTLAPRTRALILAAIALVIGAELLYLVDQISAEYVGYPRFHYLSWPLLSLAPLALLHAYPTARTKILATTLIAAALNLLAATPSFLAAAGPDYTRNFREHYMGPMFFPIQSLLDRLPETHADWLLAVNNPVDGHWLPFSLGAGYAHTLRSFKEVTLNNDLTCACNGTKQASLILDVYPTSDEPRKRVPSRFAQPTLKACVERLKASCTHVHTELAEDGWLVGAVGYTP